MTTSQAGTMLTSRRRRFRWWSRLLMSFRSVGLRPRRAVVLFGVLGFVGSAVVGSVTGPPAPIIHDEFAYLLTAHTFVEGRLTNPTHPKWHHFESFHIIHEPSYQAKYPPGQGVLLAIGMKVFGAAYWGVWLGAGFLAAALAWGLLAWLPPAWAVAGSIYGTVHLTWATYWSQSYWGGAVAAIGGAIAFGACQRMRRHPDIASGLLLGLGFGVLAASRPFEGLIVAVILSSALLVHLWKRFRLEAARNLLGSGAAALTIAFASIAGLAVYNNAVTGSPLRLPYQEHEAQYSAAPSTLLERPDEAPQYRHEIMQRYWMEWGRMRHEASRSADNILPRTIYGVRTLGAFFLGGGALGLIGLLLRRRSKFMGETTALLVVAAVLPAVLLTKGIYPHYAAPATVAVLFIASAGLAHLHRRARRLGVLDVSALIFITAMIVSTLNVVEFMDRPPSRFATLRQLVTDRLNQQPGQDLVFVQYPAQHSYHEEWVYNSASIDGSPIVWARSMDSVRDADLMRYYSDRRAWLLTPGDTLRLLPLRLIE